MKSNSFYVIQSWMSKELKLTGTKKEIFAIIFGFSQDGESKFYGNIDYISELTGVHRSTVSAIIKSLVEENLIIRTLRSGNSSIYSVNLEEVDRIRNNFNENSRVTPKWVDPKSVDLVTPKWVDSSNTPPSNSSNSVNLFNIIDNKEIDKRETKSEKSDYCHSSTKEIVEEKSCAKEKHIDDEKFNDFEIFNEPLKENKSKRNEYVADYVNEIYDRWQSSRLYKHTCIPKNLESIINRVLKSGISISDIMLCIDRYSTVQNDKNYWWKYTYTLENFLDKCYGKQNAPFEKFLDNGECWINYTSQNKKTNCLHTDKELHSVANLGHEALMQKLEDDKKKIREMMQNTDIKKI